MTTICIHSKYLTTFHKLLSAVRSFGFYYFDLFIDSVNSAVYKFELF